MLEIEAIDTALLIPKDSTQSSLLLWVRGPIEAAAVAVASAIVIQRTIIKAERE